MQNKGKLCAKFTQMKETKVDLSLIHVKLDKKEASDFYCNLKCNRTQFVTVEILRHFSYVT